MTRERNGSGGRGGGDLAEEGLNEMHLSAEVERIESHLPLSPLFPESRKGHRKKYGKIEESNPHRPRKNMVLLVNVGPPISKNLSQNCLDF